MPSPGDYKVQPAIPGLGEPYEFPEDPGTAEASRTDSLRELSPEEVLMILEEVSGTTETSLEDLISELSPEQTLWVFDEVHTKEVEIEKAGRSVEGTKEEVLHRAVAAAAFKSGKLLNINVAAA